MNPRMIASRLVIAGMAVLAVATCSNGVAQPCSAGSVDCPCRAGRACDPGLVCVDEICVARVSTSLAVTDAAARTCEAVFNDDAAVESVQFHSSLKGHHVRRAGTLAVSFIQTRDEPFPDDAVTMALAPGRAAAEVQLANSQCWDRLGRGLAAATVNLASQP